MKWNKVSEALPPEGVQVLTLNLTNPNFPEFNLDYLVSFHENHDPAWIWACILQDDYAKVTHWMPLPELPDGYQSQP
jgi:hypothetical protein